MDKHTDELVNRALEAAILLTGPEEHRLQINDPLRRVEESAGENDRAGVNFRGRQKRISVRVCTLQKSTQKL